MTALVGEMRHPNQLSSDELPFTRFLDPGSNDQSSNCPTPLPAAKGFPTRYKTADIFFLSVAKRHARTPYFTCNTLSLLRSAVHTRPSAAVSTLHEVFPCNYDYLNPALAQHACEIVRTNTCSYGTYVAGTTLEAENFVYNPVATFRRSTSPALMEYEYVPAVNQ